MIADPSGRRLIVQVRESSRIRLFDLPLDGRPERNAARLSHFACRCAAVAGAYPNCILDRRHILVRLLSATRDGVVDFAGFGCLRFRYGLLHMVFYVDGLR